MALNLSRHLRGVHRRDDPYGRSPVTDAQVTEFCLQLQRPAERAHHEGAASTPLWHLIAHRHLTDLFLEQDFMTGNRFDYMKWLENMDSHRVTLLDVFMDMLGYCPDFLGRFCVRVFSPVPASLSFTRLCRTLSGTNCLFASTRNEEEEFVVVLKQYSMIPSARGRRNWEVFAMNMLGTLYHRDDFVIRPGYDDFDYPKFIRKFSGPEYNLFHLVMPAMEGWTLASFERFYCRLIEELFGKPLPQQRDDAPPPSPLPTSLPSSYSPVKWVPVAEKHQLGTWKELRYFKGDTNGKDNAYCPACDYYLTNGFIVPCLHPICAHCAKETVDCPQCMVTVVGYVHY